MQHDTQKVRRHARHIIESVHEREIIQLHEMSTCFAYFDA